MHITDKLKKHLPVGTKYLLKKILYIYPSIANYCYDLTRFLKYSTTVRKPSDFHQLQARIIATYHVVEKGITMPKRRLGFGKENINRLVYLLRQYNAAGFPTDDKQYTAAINALKSYIKVHKDAGQDPDWVNKAAYQLLESRPEGNSHVRLTRTDILSRSQGNFADLVQCRHSVRNFSSETVPDNLLLRAIELAQHSPSVCNRQTSKVYILSDKEDITRALACQNGNRGFGQLVNKLLIVTSSLKSFDGIGERNQCFIDGGMYSMSLLYSLHFLGLGACPLNWSAPKARDKKLRRVVAIAPEDNVIMMIGVGHLPNEFSVAKSERRTLEQVIVRTGIRNGEDALSR